MRERIAKSPTCGKCDGGTCRCAQRKSIAAREADVHEQTADRFATRMRGATVPATSVHALSGDGRLPAAVRAPFEERLGFDFSRVRLHADDDAARQARRLDAHAFTVADDIYFGARQFAPHTAAGRELLAHELMHTVQQRGGAPTVQRKSCGGCANVDNVDEKRDEMWAAGKAAHEQIQDAFSNVLRSEAEIPRATKEGGRVGTTCPKRDTPSGRADLLGYIMGDIEIGEIKSIEGAEHAKPQVTHYLRRAGEATDRILQKKHPMCPGKAETEDIAFDNEYLAGSTQRGNDPNLKPLTTFVPAIPTWLGPFKRDPRKQLYCQRAADGGVLYWCNRRKRKEDEKRKQPFKYAVKEAERRRQRVRVVDYDARFRDLIKSLPGADWIDGSRLLFAVSDQIYQGLLGAEQVARTLRLMTVDMRSLPIYNFRTLTWATVAAIVAPAELALLTAMAAEAIPLIIASFAETGATAGAVAEVTEGVEVAETVETGVQTAKTVQQAAQVIEVVDATGTAVTATTTAANAIETIPLWMAPAAQEFAKQSALLIVGILVAAQMSPDDAAKAAEGALKNKHVFTVLDVTNAGGSSSVGDTVTAAGEKFRVVAKMES